MFFLEKPALPDKTQCSSWNKPALPDKTQCSSWKNPLYLIKPSVLLGINPLYLIKVLSVPHQRFLFRLILNLHQFSAVEVALGLLQDNRVWCRGWCSGWECRVESNGFPPFSNVIRGVKWREHSQSRHVWRVWMFTWKRNGDLDFPVERETKQEFKIGNLEQWLTADFMPILCLYF